jgi:chromosome segregation ATPase
MQDLDQRLADRDDRIQELEAENEALRDRLTDFEERLASLEADQVPTATADD